MANISCSFSHEYEHALNGSLAFLLFLELRNALAYGKEQIQFLKQLCCSITTLLLIFTSLYRL